MQQLSLWSPPASGLIVHRASRTEHLAERLARELALARPADPLRPQSVVIAHTGLRRWLLGEFARRPSTHGPGIAANIETLLPWEWLQRTARKVLGDEELIGGHWRRESLRWHVFAALPAVDEPQVLAYLHADESARRRFALAERMAGVFEQYL
ncbi:MAG: exodeoxyribonuclease V subunit gamma, partial [Rudaea sp.]